MIQPRARLTGTSEEEVNRFLHEQEVRQKLSAAAAKKSSPLVNKMLQLLDDSEDVDEAALASEMRNNIAIFEAKRSRSELFDMMDIRTRRKPGEGNQAPSTDFGNYMYSIEESRNHEKSYQKFLEDGLQVKLEEAVDRGDFEGAAIYRDQIRSVDPVWNLDGLWEHDNSIGGNEAGFSPEERDLGKQVLNIWNFAISYKDGKLIASSYDDFHDVGRAIRIIDMEAMQAFDETVDSSRVAERERERTIRANQHLIENNVTGGKIADVLNQFTTYHRTFQVDLSHSGKMLESTYRGDEMLGDDVREYVLTENSIAFSMYEIKLRVHQNYPYLELVAKRVGKKSSSFPDEMRAYYRLVRAGDIQSRVTSSRARRGNSFTLGRDNISSLKEIFH